MKTVLKFLLVPLIGAVLLGCSDDSDSSDGAADTPAAEGTVVIEDFEFNPETLKVKAGESITVRNEGNTTHTMSAVERSLFDTGELGSGKVANVSVDKPGKYDFHCEIHEQMKGTLEVS